MRTFIVGIFMMAGLLNACKERIVEYASGDDKIFHNDLLHGDLVGRILQKDLQATVIVSQVAVVDSTTVNPVDGSFAFRDLRAGNYDVKIVAENFRIYSHSNVVIPGGTITYLGEIDLSTIPDLVASTYPADNSEIVYDWRYGRITISILFTQPMDRQSVEGAFSTSPPSEGIFTWGTYTQAPASEMYAMNADARFETGATITTYSKVTSMTYRMAKKDARVDTNFLVMLGTDAHDTSGNHLRFPLRFAFRTVQSYNTIYGIQTTPVHGDIDVEPMSYSGMTLTFPRRMNAASTEMATTVTPPMNKMFLWREENVLLIYPGGPFLSDTTIAVTVDGSALDKDGIALGKAFSFSFRTAPFRVQSTYPSNADLFVSPTQQISIYFNSYVIKSTVESAFSISPSVSGFFVYGGTSPYENRNQIVFTPNTGLQPNTKYTVTVTTGAKDMYNVPLKAPYSFSFVTRPN